MRATAPVLILLLASLLLPAPWARAADADSDYATWGEAADAVVAELDAALSSYRSGDTAGAAAGFRRTYSSGYVASNLSEVIAARIGQETRDDHTSQFSALRKDARTSGNEESLAQGVETLTSDLTTAATELDAIADLPGPRDYASRQATAIASQRAELDASKTRVNEGRGDRSWTQVAAEMNELINQGVDKAQAGDGKAGAALVNQAYYGYYEKLGFEKTVMAAISGSRVSEVENQFKVVRKAMIAGKTGQDLTSEADRLTSMLTQDAAALDGGAAQVGPVRAFLSGSFGQAFLILLREGLEAILVVAATIAYLVKAGMKDRVKHIYLGVAAGLAASGVVAVLFRVLYNSASSHQEVLEGIVALAAMVMLLFTSNWMLSKSSTQAWSRYIKDRAAASISNGGVWALASLSFLAVFREGAETILFYEALLAIDPGGSTSIWQGFAAGAAVLVVIFLLIRYTSVRIPLRPFFLITSIMLSLLVVVFAGGGSHALLEGDVIPATYLQGWPTYDYLGVYPYVETLSVQAVMAVIVITLAVISLMRQRAARAQDGSAPSTDEG
ncbi:FTR1 family protein [Actinomyces slackii]|uniref:Ferrous iron uptake protein n=1 Tax=Actinomyces slackii TaxID=52774 RepID=A0A3S4STS9_9ACTO|nr:FTR1 family protein [Actinomyces slackii]VEG74871.1 Ferrous iron uptake protein [Actinomyces slackii]